MTKQADELISSAYKKMGIDVSKIVLVVLSFFYATGYLIQAITLRNYGIHRLEAVKLQYIEVGVTFSVLLLLVTVMPVACYMAHFRIRKRSELPHYRVGAAGYLANTYNLLFLVVSFALFVTQREWYETILTWGKSNHPISLSQVFPIYATISVFVLIFLPVVERKIVGGARYVKVLYATVVEPIRFVAVIFGIAIDFLLLKSFPWVQHLVLRGLTFVASAVSVAAVAWIIMFYMRKLGDRLSLHVLAAVGTAGLFMLMYICINAYVYSIVRHMPINRGGKLPLIRSYLVTGSKVLKNLPISQKTGDECVVIGPVYVVDETQDYLHVAKEENDRWYQEWVRTYAINKDEIVYVDNVRIEQGGPRDHLP